MEEPPKDTEENNDVSEVEDDEEPNDMAEEYYIESEPYHFVELEKLRGRRL